MVATVEKSGRKMDELEGRSQAGILEMNGDRRDRKI
jgi:hypothetical protein